MWPFSNKTTLAACGALKGATDHHSHILPGVDDGIESIDEALRILAEYEEIGIKRLWLTPHIMEDIPNTPEKLQARFGELKAVYNGNIELNLAAEYMLDNNLRTLLKEGTLLPIGSKRNHILVETSYYNPPMRLHETLKQIKSQGYHPLLAHPERYLYMSNADYTTLHDEGVKFQLNLPSLAGAYGKQVKKRAEWLLKNSLYTACGSDLHCEEGLEYILACKLSEKQTERLAQLLKTKI